ncbi:hypothetical protein O181_086329 [Austropuccinia psidii MF-1]|uniref:Uncharacterized protein n=1 Tax=Austropuccinia psidii MF-1 TaxID=1389203 RepID=A0A9Q3FWS4_9BASI|nr:hypothetical protein [Austropuccinia psidii MF-1]
MSPVHLRNLEGTSQGTEKASPEPEDLSSTETSNQRTGSIWIKLFTFFPSTPHRPFSMEHGQQKAQASNPLGRTWSKFPEEISQRDRLQRPYGNHQRLESHQTVQTPGGEGKQDKGESSHYSSYRRTTDLDREY